MADYSSMNVENVEKKFPYRIMNDLNLKQAGAELGQAQLKLGLDLNSINLNEISFIVLVE